MDTILMFRFAKLYNFYTHPFIIALRIVILLFVFVMFVFSIQQGLSVRFPLGLLLLFSMIELFVKVKLMSMKPKRTVEEVSHMNSQATFDRLLETVTLPAAAVLLRHNNPVAFMQKLKREKEVRFVQQRANISSSELPSQKVDVGELISLAYDFAREQEKPYVTTLDLFGAYLLLNEKKTKLLFKKELKKEDLLTIIAWAQSVYTSELTIALPKVTPWGGGIGEEWVSGWTLETKKYTQDFTRRSLASHPISVGREKEYDLLVEALLKSKQSNVLLLGPPGVGKQEVVARFAIESFLGNPSTGSGHGVPKGFRFVRVLELFSGSLVAGSINSGDLEQRLHSILSEISHAGDVVLFIPEIQNIAGAGSDGLDVTGVLLPHLLEDKMHIIATITPENYKAYLEDRSEFVEAFEKIILTEPKKEEAIPMVLDAALSLGKIHKVIFTYKSAVAAVELSEKYMPDRFLPGKAIALLDEVATKVRLSEKILIEKGDIVGLLEAKLPVKISKPNEEEKELLLALEKKLHERIIDQDEAVKIISEAMRRLRSGLSMGKRPVGVFLFLGPTGVGKTETAKALSQFYFGQEWDKTAQRSFGSEDAMIRFDMSEYQDRSVAPRLIEELTDKVRAKPFSLVLLDEFEKAYYSIHDIFLSVFEDGRLTNDASRVVSFANTIIIATSNAGSELIREGVAEKIDLSSIKPQLLDWLQKEGLFKPELLNRFDAVVLFEPLGPKEVEQVTELLLRDLATVLEKKDIAFTFTKKAIAKIAKEGFDPTMGARPLRRFIADHVEDLLSKKLLTDEVKRGDIVTLSTDSANTLTLDVKSTTV